MVKDHSDSERGNLLAPLHGILLYAPSHRQDRTYHSFCYTSCGPLAGMRNSSMSPPHGIDLMTHHTMSRHSTTELY